MKIFICGSFGLLLLCLPAYATDERPSLLEEFRIFSKQANPTKKRLASINIEEEPTTASKTPKRTAREDRASAREYKKEVLMMVTRKADILNRELPKATESLNVIYRDLQKIAATYMNSNPPRACELAALASDLMSLSKSIKAVMGNLKTQGYDNQQTLLHTSLAIPASGALTPQIDRIVDALQSVEDTRGINCTILKEVSAEIKRITKDSDVKNFRLSEGTE